jgi:pilus assembly protein CpaB
MRPKSLILLGLALGCGLVAAVGINQILATPSSDVQTVGIVVAKKEIKKGDLIKPDDIRLQEWHVDALPEGAIQTIDDLAERRVKTLVVPGEALLESKLVPKGVRDTEIPAGMKAVTVQVDTVTGLHGQVSPGDNVDLLVFTPANGATKTARTRLLYRNIKVHAIDNIIDRPDAGEPATVARTVTLLASAKQAAAITHASHIGDIQLVGRSSKDNEGEDDTLDLTVDDNSLFNGGSDEPTDAGGPALSTITPEPAGVGADMGKGILDLIKEMRNLGPVEPVEQPWKIVLIEGIERKELEFTKDSKVPQLTGAGSGGGAAAKPADQGSVDDIISKLPPIDQEDGN